MSLECLKFKDFKFLNNLKPYSVRDYLYAEKEFVSRYSKLPFVKSIYLWNSELVPGVSDMDFILVLNDKITGAPKNGFNIERFSSKLRYFYYHNPLVINEDLLHNFDRLFLKAEIRNCYGKEIEVEKLANDERRLHKVQTLTEAIVRHLPRNILNCFLSKKVDTRYTLLVLNLLKYSIEALKSIDNDKIGRFNDFIDECNYLRNNWFNLANNKYKLLFHAAINAIHVSLDFIEFFTNYLIDNNFIYKKNPAKESYLKFFSRGHFTIFFGKWEKEDALNKTLSIYKRIKRSISILPLPLSYQITDYSRWDSLLGNYIRNNITPTKRIWYCSNQDIIKKRHFLLNSYLDFHAANNIQIRYYNVVGYYGKNERYAKLVHQLKKMFARIVMNSYS